MSFAADLFAELDWVDRANCAGLDPDLFFPERGSNCTEAKRVCAGCVVRVECLEYAVANCIKFGVWGGMSHKERRHMHAGSVAS